MPYDQIITLAAADPGLFLSRLVQAHAAVFGNIFVEPGYDLTLKF
jgi:hypothetical protein